MKIEKTTLLIKRIKLNFDMSNRYRCKIFQNLNSSKSQITISRFSTRVASRRFNSVQRERDYFSVLSETNRKFQISIRFSRVEQITQKWRSFVVRFSSIFLHKKTMLNKRKDEIICYNCDKQNHVQSKCLISLNKIEFRYAKKDRNL
jgi:hypothetical protein